MNVTNDPVDGCERENWLSVLPSSAIAIAAATTVSGAAIPAVETISANPKKKLIAGAMFASVAAEISKLVSTPRARRAGAGRWGVPTGVVPTVATIPSSRSWRPVKLPHHRLVQASPPVVDHSGNR